MGASALAVHTQESWWPTPVTFVPFGTTTSKLRGAQWQRAAQTDPVLPEALRCATLAALALGAVVARRSRVVRRRVAGSRSAGASVCGPSRPQRSIEPPQDLVSDLFFGAWAQWTCAQFQSRFHLRALELPEHLRIRRGGRRGDAVIQSLVFVPVADSPLRRLRLTLVRDGERIHALNLAAYPAYARGPLPVFGADLLSFNHHKRMLFGLDWAPMSPDRRYSAALITPHLHDVSHGEHSAFASMPSNRFYGDEPEFFSPEIFFSRPDNVQQMEPGSPLWKVFCAYATRYCDMLSGVDTFPDTARVAEVRQGTYDRWHAQRDPALPIFSKLFGRAWTEEYVRSILFPGVADPETHIQQDWVSAFVSSAKT